MYRIVVADSQSPRDGRFIEVIGQYSPREAPADGAKTGRLSIETERAQLLARCRCAAERHRAFAAAAGWRAKVRHEARVATKRQRGRRAAQDDAERERRERRTDMTRPST